MSKKGVFLHKADGVFSFSFHKPMAGHTERWEEIKEKKSMCLEGGILDHDRWLNSAIDIKRHQACYKEWNSHCLRSSPLILTHMIY